MLDIYEYLRVLRSIDDHWSHAESRLLIWVSYSIANPNNRDLIILFISLFLWNSEWNYCSTLIRAGWWFQIFFYFHPYLGQIPILTNIFQMGWNHQPEIIDLLLVCLCLPTGWWTCPAIPWAAFGMAGCPSVSDRWHWERSVNVWRAF